MWYAVAATITAISALAVAIYSARRARESQRDIELLRDRLLGERSLDEARRQYEFRARQRLYEQYEPVRFQLLEAIETAKCQIETMASQALDADRLGTTPTGNYWLLGTIYHLLHPAAVFRIAQRRLTLIDLRIDPASHFEYVLAKKAYLALSHDARMAEITAMPYTPYVEGWKEKREMNPGQFRRQGLPLGRLDNALDTLIVRSGENRETERMATFGEFESRYGQAAIEDVRSPVGAARDLFVGFSPVTRPILWRLLLCQFVMYKALLGSISGATTPLSILKTPWVYLDAAEAAWLGYQRDDLAFDTVSSYLTKYVLPDLPETK